MELSKACKPIGVDELVLLRMNGFPYAESFNASSIVGLVVGIGELSVGPIAKKELTSPALPSVVSRILS